MSKDAFINKYRPIDFPEVMGNDSVVKALQAAVSSASCPHAFLLTGPSGTGKTTLARIIASTINAVVEELDGPSHAGVDDMRQIVQSAQFQPITIQTSKMLIIDEAHSLSKNAFSAILKLIEEPPSYLYIALATTELTKIPDAIRTRSYHVSLKPLQRNEIEDLVTVISEMEGWILNNDVFAAIVQASTGQPRKALSILQAGHSAQSREELANIIVDVETENSSLLELCRFLAKGGKDWGVISALLLKLEDSEDVIAQANRWLFTAMANAGSEQQAKNYWRILDAISFPRTGFDKKVQLATAVGALVWG